MDLLLILLRVYFYGVSRGMGSGGERKAPCIIIFVLGASSPSSSSPESQAHVVELLNGNQCIHLKLQICIRYTFDFTYKKMLGYHKKNIQ